MTKPELSWVESPENSPITWVHGFHPETGALVVSFDCDPYGALWRVKRFNVHPTQNMANDAFSLGQPYRDAASCRAAWEAYVEMQDKLHQEYTHAEVLALAQGIIYQSPGPAPINCPECRFSTMGYLRIHGYQPNYCGMCRYRFSAKPTIWERLRRWFA